MALPRVSIVIPTRDGAATLPDVLDAISSQRFAGVVEVIAIDSGSSDSTRELLKDRVDRLITVESELFNHGLTRNLGIDAATGDLVVLLVQDAVPHAEDWLSSLIAPLLADPTIAGSFARQIPRPAAGRLTRHYHARWVASSTVPFVSTLEDERELDGLTPSERHIRCAFDNVCSCVRRAVWTEHPFVKTPIAEDLEWARQVLLAGHRIAFVPGAVVTHSHERSVRYEFDRTRAAHERLSRLFELRQVPNLPALAVAVLASLVSHTRLELPAPTRLPRAWALAIAWPLGQYLGARRVRTGDPRSSGRGPQS